MKHHIYLDANGEFQFGFEYPDQVEGYPVRVEPGKPYSLYYPSTPITPLKIKWYKEDGTFISEDVSTAIGVPAPEGAAWAGFLR